MNPKDATTQDLDYVIGCLFFCAETLASLGQQELADELTALCSHLLPAVGKPNPARRREAVH